MPRAIDRPVSHPIRGVSKRIRIRTILRNRSSVIDFHLERDLLDVILPSRPYLNRYARHFASDKPSGPAHIDAPLKTLCSRMSLRRSTMIRAPPGSRVRPLHMLGTTSVIRRIA
ncbi:MAG: hypothetical protein OJF47_003793 [Nitrospira sp.]|nr:MAG: hypothetical protein OJF47_003793 [Nitrospira sp.]